MSCIPQKRVSTSVGQDKAQPCPCHPKGRCSPEFFPTPTIVKGVPGSSIFFNSYNGANSHLGCCKQNYCPYSVHRKSFSHTWALSIGKFFYTHPAKIHFNRVGTGELAVNCTQVCNFIHNINSNSGRFKRTVFLDFEILIATQRSGREKHATFLSLLISLILDAIPL